MTELVDELLGRLDLREKVALLGGTDWWHTAAVERVDIPPLKMSDGPAGVRGAHFTGGPASASFPCGTALGATWDVDLVGRVGTALAAELHSKGAHLILGPTVNLHRTPLAGRNFECFSEDPFLTARLAVAYIEAVQAEGVGATVKHFVANDSEFERMSISSEVPERALRELYLLPFEAAVREAGTWAIMTGYNRLAGTFCSENEWLLRSLLRDEWGFDGMVVSDWFGTHSTEAATRAGLDLEMPGPPLHRGDALVQAVESGALPEALLDDRVRKVLQLAERTGVLARTASDPTVEVHDDDPQRRVLLRDASAASIVLLRNEPLADGATLLPLDAATLTSVAVLGPTASLASAQGGGSALVPSPYEVSPLEGLTSALGSSVRVVHEQGAVITRGPGRIDPARLRTSGGERGLDVDYVAGPDPEGEVVQHDVSRRSWFQWDPQFHPGGSTGPWSVRMTATYTAAWSGEHVFGARTDGKVRLRIGEAAADSWDADAGRRTVTVIAELSAGASVDVVLDFAAADPDQMFGLDFRVLEPVPADLADRAVAAAAAADVAVLVVGLDSTWETEGKDRTDLSLPGGQAELVSRVVAANPRTVVVVNTGAPIDMAWADEVPAIVQLWYPGQEGGNALADVLLGVVNPGGKLPTTFPHRLADHPSMLNYPGERGAVVYGEGLFIGYRAFDRTGTEPRFAFGHGLSYTTFEYGPLVLSTDLVGADRSVTASVDVTNSGDVDGDEVVQLYVADLEASVARPPKELKGFRRVRIAAGATTTVSFELDERSFAFWDPSGPGWAAEPGEFEVLVGSSSRDIRSKATLALAD